MPTSPDPQTDRAAGALTPLHAPATSARLRDVSLVDLSTEVLARLQTGDRYGGYVTLGEQLRHAVAVAVDVHENRFSATRSRDQLQPILSRLAPGALNNATVVDLGCGSLNPFVFSFLLLMLGARRAVAIDLEPIQDLRVAAQAMAAAAGWMLVDPERIVGPGIITAEEVLRNLRGFSLPLLAAGRQGGIATERLQHRVESIYELSLGDGEADAVFTVSVLEHLERLDDALAELRRVTRPGGIGHHVVDFSDHRRYAESYGITNAREFLKADRFAPAERMHWSNRVRCAELCSMFERRGFVVEDSQAAHLEPLSAEERAAFVEPFRSMEQRSLETIVARLLVRRL